MVRTTWSRFSQADLLRLNHDWCNVERRTDHGKFTWYRRQPKRNKPGFPATHREGTHQTHESIAVVIGKRQVVKLECAVPQFICSGDLCILYALGNFEHLAVTVLPGTPFLDWCIWTILLTERKVVPSHSSPVVIITMKTAIDSINPTLRY